MKFVGFFEASPENLEKIHVREKEWHKEYQQNPEKYSKYMRLQDGTAIAFAMIGQYKGLTLIEADTEEQMQNAVSFWAPLMKLTFVPIIQTPSGRQL
jgi:hypothetical protein